ncbi:hypothetical protein D3C85_810300 [compost metagenome]
MPGHAQEREGGDQQPEQDAAVVGVVLDGVDQSRTFAAGGRFHGGQVRPGQCRAQQNQAAEQGFRTGIPQHGERAVATTGEVHGKVSWFTTV